MGLAIACGGKTAGVGGPGGGSSSSGGGSSGSGSGGSQYNSCFETSGSPTACITCVETQCASELASVEIGCADLLQCECPGGVYSASTAQACAPKGQEASCTGPVTQIDQCVTQRCTSQCTSNSGSGGSSGGPSSSGGSSSGVSSGGSGGSGSSGGPPPAGCTVDASIFCTGGATGFACLVGDNPEVADPSLSCSTPTLSGGQDHYCCFSGGPWSQTTCLPDDTLTSVCPDPTSYGYVCASGDDPTSFDPRLNCSSPVPDADGVHDDFCCIPG